MYSYCSPRKGKERQNIMKMKKTDFGIFETEFIPTQPNYQLTILQYPNTRRETDRTYGFGLDKIDAVRTMLEELPNEFAPQVFASKLAELGIDAMGIGRIPAGSVFN